MERWKDIPGYEGLYTVSDNGNVFSVRADKIMSPGCKRKPNSRHKGKTILPYKYVNLIDDNGNRKTFFVHRLVMLSFKGPMPADCNCVMHLNDNPEDNRFCNLKYGSQSENTKDSFAKGRSKPSTYFHNKSGKQNWRSIPVIAFKDGVLYKEYDSMRIAEKETGIDICTISNSIKHNRQTFGYQFKKGI